MNKLERILVTGGAGFIGSHTVDLLLKQGKQVVVLDNLSSGNIENLNMQHPDLEFFEGDVLEYPLLEGLVANCDAVLHLAAISSVPQSIANPIYSFQVNTQGFLHVLQAIKKSKRDIRLVYASSAAVYGNVSALPCRDDQPLSGEVLSPYALQKIHDEHYADLFERLHGIKSLGLRYFNVYGPRQDPASPYSGVISRFINAYKSDAELTIFGDGQQSRDFISVTDVALANQMALDSDFNGVLNIATGKGETLLQLIDYIAMAGNHPAKLQFEAPRVGDIKSSYAATEKALSSIKFKATIPLQEGMNLMINQP